MDKCMRPDCESKAQYQTRVAFPSLAEGNDSLVVVLKLCFKHTLFKTAEAVDIVGHLLDVKSL